MRAQASLDSLLMIGLGLILAAAFFFVANTLLTDSIAASQAEEAVERIAQEVKYVYSSGQGTLRYVDVTIPNGIEEINIDGNRVHMKVQLSSGSTDFYSNTPVKLVGSIDPYPGQERIEVRYLDSGNVQVGELKLTADPKSLHFYLVRSETDSAVVTVTNNANFTINGIVATQEGLMDIVGISGPSASLDPGEGGNVQVSVSVPSDKPIGTYTGYIRVSSTNDGSDDVFVSVSVQGGAPSKCILSPGSSDLSLGQSREFTASCENAANEPVPCPLMSWSSDAGNVIPAFSYSSSTLIATDAEGTIIEAGNGFGCSAPVTVSGRGPLITGLGIDPASPLESDPITVNVTGDDTGRGNLNISLCQVKVDTEVWKDMSASDGVYDEATEDAYLPIGSLSAGQHSSTVRCNDSSGLWGPESTLNFTVGPI